MLFSHDGIHDSQTHLASPSYFYEQLKREISLANRSLKPIALIKIVFEKPDSKDIHAYDILHFSNELTLLTRDEECIGRLGVNEIVMIVRDGIGDSSHLVNRLLDSTALTVNHTLCVKIARVFGEVGEDSLALLDRLDRAELTTR
jgi:GGDEF domain-containing protein